LSDEQKGPAGKVPQQAAKPTETAEPIPSGFANTKEGQDKEEALRLDNLKEQKRQADLRDKQNEDAKKKYGTSK